MASKVPGDCGLEDDGTSKKSLVTTFGSTETLYAEPEDIGAVYL